MSSTTTMIATVESNHTIKVPSHLPIDEQVLVVRMPSITALLNDSRRRSRFAATRKAIQQALEANLSSQFPSNEEIVQLVKRARQTIRDE